MSRRLLNVLMAVSLLLSVAVVALWVRSGGRPPRTGPGVPLPALSAI